MSLRPHRTLILLLGLLCALWAGQALAQSPLGIGASDPSTSVPSGIFSSLISAINQYQQEFYQALRETLVAMRNEPSNLWWLIAMSFAYGVFHAAGPGHGKVIIASYMIANEVQLKRGILLSFVSALAQGVMAIIVVGATWLVLRHLGVTSTQTTFGLELLSYGLIIAIGLWLLWRKSAPLLQKMTIHQIVPGHTALATAAAPSDHHSHHAHHHHHHAHIQSHGPTCGHHHDDDNGHHHHNHHHAHHHEHHHEHKAAAHEVCPSCGHAHMPDPSLLDEKLNLKDTWSVIMAVGIRPCSGAIIVLTFSLLNGLYMGGILSVFAMAIGTAITVSLLAILAVTAKNVALRLSDGSGTAHRIGTLIEILGALIIILFGVSLMSAALN